MSTNNFPGVVSREDAEALSRFLMSDEAREPFRYCGSSRAVWSSRSPPCANFQNIPKAEPLPVPKPRAQFIPKLLTGGWRLMGRVFCKRDLPDSWQPVPRTVMSAWGSL